MIEFILITSESVPNDDAAFAEHAQKFGDELAVVAGSLIVGSFSDYPATPSEDGTTSLHRLQIFEDQDNDIALLTDTAAEFSRDGFRVLAFGNTSINAAFSELVEKDLLVGESIGIGVALTILALVFRAVLTCLTLLPALIGILGNKVNSVRVPQSPL